jgi:hypothetical protein
MKQKMKRRNMMKKKMKRNMMKQKMKRNMMKMSIFIINSPMIDYEEEHNQRFEKQKNE